MILPYLFEENIRYIDAAIATHSDADHMEGIIGLLGKVEIGTIYAIRDDSALYQKLKETAAVYGIPMRELFEGDKIELSPLTLRVLSPSKDMLAYTGDNDRSIVIAAQVDGKEFLFLADAERKAQSHLINNASHNILLSDVAKVPHHGAQPKSPAFMTRMLSEYYVISVGRNGYGLPSDYWTERGEAGKVLRTDESGCITFAVEHGELVVEEYLRQRD